MLVVVVVVIDSCVRYRKNVSGDFSDDPVALLGLAGDQLVVLLAGRSLAHALNLVALGHVAATATIREVDAEALAVGLDLDVVDLVRSAVLKLEVRAVDQLSHDGLSLLGECLVLT